jgi:hypothetical protein
MRLNRREMLDHLHTLAHYVSAGGEPLFEHVRDESGARTVFTIAVERERYWRLLAATQQTRDLVRSGRYAGVVERDRPIALERYTDAVRLFLLDEHIVLGEMLRDSEPMFIWTRGATTAAGRPVHIRRYAYVPEEFRRRAEAMGIVTPPLPATGKRDQGRRW